MKAIADTGFIVAFANRRDRFHDWAVAVAHEVETPLLTCEAVLSEAAFHLENSALTLALVNEGLLKLGFDLSRQLPHVRALAARYADRKPDLADLCLIRMSELNPKHRVATVDARDFSVFRRNGREVIPTLTPPR